MKQRYNLKKQQRGLALIATLLVVAIFTFIGMNIATKGKKNQEMTGANVRNNVVFEASEMTLRRALQFINAIKHGAPKTVDRVNASAFDEDVRNFNVEEVFVDKDKTPPDFVHDKGLVWNSGALAKAVCSNCDKNINFIKEIDNKKLWNLAIKSTFEDDDYEENYLSHVETYTFIELLRDNSINADNYSVDGNFTGGAGRAYYYLITVKGSGFPPGTSSENKKISTNSRENVILQAVYAQQY